MYSILLKHYFSGKIGRTNVVDDVDNVKSADECQRNCSQRKNNGCQYFTWKMMTQE